jgi:uncharacterized RDD family membrane protein YckC
MQPFGICYETKSTVSYGILSKYTYSREYGESKDYVMACVSTITKIDGKPVFIYIYKRFKKSEDITEVKTINSDWLKKIEKKQGNLSFMSDFDFAYYKEIILAILTLSFIWVSYFATKRIRRNLTFKTRNKKTIEVENSELVITNVEDHKAENTLLEDTNYVDFEELLIKDEPFIKEQSTSTIENIPLNNQKDDHKINPELHKASRTVRLINFIIDMIFFFFFFFFVFVYLLGYSGNRTFVIDHPYLLNFIILFLPYFIMELIWGKSIGKFITKTHVVDSLGGKPSVWQILGRTVSRFIPFEAFTFLTNDKRGLHDTLTETYVIKD